jgi:amino acid adenylation domain-containing protein/non-ribosomal peptide synthase protein (TIGR01720 family)
MSGKSNLVELIRQRAADRPEGLAYVFLSGHDLEPSTLTYQQLDSQARTIAAFLQQSGFQGERVLLPYPPGLEFITAFLGCIYAGAIAVAAYPPRMKRNAIRIISMAEDSQAALALSTSAVVSRFNTFAQTPELGKIRWVATDDALPTQATDWRDFAPRAEDLAYLQYTSGSTAEPRGVMITHANILYNSAYIAAGFEHTPESRSLCWLPHFHDMGLIDGIIQPLYSDFTGYLMSPASFLQEPGRWLEAISRHRLTHSGGPNFAYELCTAKVPEEQRERLDLSNWQVAYNGAEPVHARTMRQFAERFQSCGFHRNAFYPAYGLAEATLKVSGGKKGRGPIHCTVKIDELEQNRIVLTSTDDPDARTLVGAGSVAQGVEIAIVAPETLVECAAGQVGEIWVSGPSVAAGYWNRPQETREIFSASIKDKGEGPFLRTGDFGFVHQGELFVTGRLKDLIIIRGRNHYPQDIETTSQSADRVLHGKSVAAFSITVGTQEKLVIIQEVDPKRSGAFARITEDIRRTVADEHEIQPHCILLVRQGAVPRTSSGKVQRHLCRQKFFEGSFKALAEWKEASSESISEHEDVAPPELTVDSLKTWLRAKFAAKLKTDISGIDLHRPVHLLGLDSLMALEVSHSVERALGVSLSQSSLLEGWSIADLAGHLVSQLNKDASSNSVAPVLSSDTIPSQFPLSQGQQALWFLQQIAPGSRAYYIARALRIINEVDVGILESAFQRLVERHPSLRTIFPLVDGKPVQHVLEHAGLFWEYQDAYRWDSIKLKQRMTEAAHRHFDLSNGPLFRVFLFSRPEGTLLLLAVHHIVADLWSIGLLLNELSEIYRAEIRNDPIELPSLPIHYAEYVNWEERFLQSEEGRQHWTYWQRRLHGHLPYLELPADFSRPPLQTFRGSVEFLGLGVKLVSQLKYAAINHNATIYTLLLALFESFLHRYTGQDDVLVGTPTTGRNRHEFARVIGYFANPVVMRMDFSGGPSFEQVMAQAHQVVLEALAHQSFPFATLVQRIQPQRDSSRSPLFQVMFVLQKTGQSTNQDLGALALSTQGAELQLGDMALSVLPIEQTVAQFDLTLSMADSGSGMVASFEYNTDLFEQATIQRMARHFEQFVRECIAYPERRIDEVPLLAGEDRRQILGEWNQTQHSWPAHETILELLEAQAQKTPQNLAIIFEDRSFTYRQLHQQANQLARFLQKLGVGPEVRVGVCMERSEKLVIALLAAMKAGGAYLPLDPTYPQERLNYMLSDSKPAVVLVSKDCKEKLHAPQARLLCLEEEWDLICAESQEPATASSGRENLAYLIYTSGSTGRPKGVMNVHGGLLNRLQWMQASYPLDETDRILQKTPFGFDVSVWEFFWPLMVGAGIVVARPEGHKDPGCLARTIQRDNVTTVHFVPSMLAAFLQEPQVESCTSLRQVISSGEVLPASIVESFHQRMPADLHNLYGPTEASIDVSSWFCTREQSKRSSVPIGRPIANTQLYILNSYFEPVPVGVTGELYIGGVGLARGYWDNSELTAEKFIPDSFSGKMGERLYRTGDLARWRADGQIEYVGRNDDQIKLRGFRIELGEIAAALTEHPAVRESIVTIREDASGEKRLVAYYTATLTELNAEQLRTHLSAKLPDYMVPAVYVLLESLPLTANGKLDRKALPAPKFESYAKEIYEEPFGEAETTLAAIWAEVLGVERVGRHDNFFALGGHSLLAMTLIERMKRSHLPVTPQAIFTTRTLAELAANAASETGVAEVPPNLIPPNCDAITPEMLPLITLSSGDIQRIIENIPGGAANVQDIYPLAPLQEGIFFHHQMSRDGDAYVIFALLSFDSRQRVDAYLDAMQKVMDRHDILRTCVLWEGLPQAVQVVQRRVILPVEEIALEQGEGDASQKFHDRFDPRKFKIELRKAPLLKIYFAQDAAHDRWLMAKLVHHLVGDNTSLQSIFQEIQAHLLGQPEQLQAPFPFRNLVAQTRLNAKIEEHEAFFRRMLSDIDEPTAPFGLLGVHGDGADLEETGFQLSAVLSQRIRASARNLAVNVATLFHVAWGVVLARVSGTKDVIFGTVLFGRMESSDDGAGHLGLFINTLPVRIGVGLKSVEASVRSTYARLTDLLCHEHASLALAQRCSAVPSPTPLFSALLNYRHRRSDPFRDEAMHISEGIKWLTSEERSNYPLTLSVDDPGEGFKLTAQAPTFVGPLRVCEFMSTALTSLVEALETRPNQAIEAFEVLGPVERQQLLVEWNRTQQEFSPGLTILQMIEQQAEIRPQALAVIDRAQELTYRELNRQANQWAHLLRKAGVRAEARVAICMERSVQMITAKLGVLKAGGAYLPLDREYPPERSRHQITDSGAKVVIAESTVCEKLRDLGQTPILCADQQQEFLRLEPQENPQWKVEPEQLAYVIYTSGSTGRPKGVEVEHRGLQNLVHWHLRAYGIETGDRGSQVAGTGFDASEWETWPYLAAGASLQIAGESERGSAKDLREWLAAKDVTISFLPTPLAEAVMRLGEWKARRLQRILTGGDRLQERPPDNWSVEVINHYGPTECTVVATAARVEKPGKSSPSIGKPISNTQVYVLNNAQDMQPAPVGVVGELYIGGAGLARGYTGQPHLTAERFVPDGLSGRAGERLYRTGDQCRWNEAGELEFIGRKDQQVKIRGYRIEIGEIEAALKEHEEVAEAVVTVQERESGEKALIAYVVAVAEKEFDSSGLRQYLQARLPAYIVPSAFVQLNAIPLTASGKLDRQALKKWEFISKSDQHDPRSETETLLAEIWKQLLRLERVSIHDSFFELGGDSIISLQVVARAGQQGIRITPRQLFEFPTIAELAAAAQRPQSEREDSSGQGRAVFPSTYPLSAMQKGILFECLAAPESGVYIQQLICTLRGHLKVEAFKNAWQRVAQCHSVLRTLIRDQQEEPVQVVRSDLAVPFELQDWRGKANEEQQSQLRLLLTADRARGFKLSEVPLFRLTLLQLAPDLYKLLLTFHHLILDGWSLPLLFQEVFARYGEQIHEESSPALSIDFYSDYIEWLQEKDLTSAETYWRRALQNFEAPISIEIGSSDHPNRNDEVFLEQQTQFSLEETADLQSTARQNGLTLSILMEAAWAILLSRYTREQDIVFGLTLSGRSANLPGIENKIGLFINALPLRTSIQSDRPLLPWLKELQKQQIELGEFEHTPLFQVQKWSGIPAGTRLFESILVFENYPLDASLLQKNDGVIIEDIQAIEITNFPLTVTAVPHSGFKVLISYDRRRFNGAAVARMLSHLKTILLGVAANPRLRIGDVPWITPPERAQLLVEWNQAGIDDPPPTYVHTMFAGQACQNPENIAVTYGAQQMTFAELDRRANQLANYLLRQGVKQETYIGLCVYRSLEMVVGILGILKAGGVYLPVDPSWPAQRKTFVLAETQTPLLLTTQDLFPVLESLNTRVVSLDSKWREIAQEEASSPSVKVSPESLAYVIYTSGTTGRPKGVMISHQALGNHLRWMQAAFPLTPEDRVPQKYALSFDVSVLEILYPLLAGARLVVAPFSEFFDAAELLGFLIDNRITAIDLVPSMLRALVQAERFPAFTTLRQVTCGGEVLERDLQEKFFSRSDAGLANLYGPTETAISSSFWRCRRGDEHSHLPIGRPVSNTALYILDPNMGPVPIGVAGEICVVGIGLARGYLHEPTQTAEKFVPHPYSQTPGERLYRTGDLGRFREDGNIEYLGRIDQQVKIRGFRIEPGEIEAALRTHSSVREVVVVAREQQLVACIVGTQPDDGNELRVYLREFLPEYMIPAHFMWLEKIPRTTNGKLDHKALPVPTQDAMRSRRYVAPRNKVERELAAIWSSLLKVAQVSVEESFFELGGDSIISLQVVSRARQQGIRITPRQLFEHRTISALATVAEITDAPKELTGQGTLEGDVALTPIQRWFFDQEFEEAHHYNQAVLLEAANELRTEWLEAAWQKLVEHHDALRLRFHREGGSWRETIDREEQNQFFSIVELTGNDDRSLQLEHIIEQMQRSLNFERGPLLRVAHVNPKQVVVVVHHLAVDGVSWRILLEDLEKAYGQLSRKEGVRFPAKTDSYQTWAEQLACGVESTRYESELNYWLREEGKATATMPVNWDGTENHEEDRAYIKVHLDQENTRQLLHDVPRAYRTQINDVLLTAVLGAWEKWTGQTRLLLDVEGHGRELPELDVSRTVGWFTSVYPVTLEVKREDGTGERLKAIKEQLRRVPSQGVGYGTLRYLDGKTTDRLARQPKAEISFNYLGQVDGTLPEGGVFRRVEPIETGCRGGKNLRSHELEIEARAEDGRLQVAWHYNRKRQRPEEIQSLAGNFLDELKTIIRHCLAFEVGGFTSSDFPLAHLDQQMLDRLANEHRNISDIYPLSPIQQGLLFHTLYDESRSGTYVEQLSCTLEGNLDILAFEQAWQEAVDAHPVLRTCFIWEGLEEPHQVVHQSAGARFVHLNHGQIDGEQTLEELSRTDAQQGFDLAQPPLMRLILVRLESGKFEFLWSSHHLLLDGWGMSLVLKEVLERYTARCNDQNLPVSWRRPYRDYISWVHQQDLNSAKKYWQALLKDFSTATPLPGRRPLPSSNSNKNYSDEQIALSKSATIQLQTAVRHCEVTLSVAVQAAWALLLRYYTSQNDLVFGVTVSGRPAALAGIEKVVGVFINTLPMRINIAAGSTAGSILKTLQTLQLRMDEYAFTPLSKILEWSEIPAGLPLFETIVVFENYPVDASLKEPRAELKFSNVRSHANTNYPLALIVKPDAELALQLSYDARRFESSMVRRLLGHLCNLLSAIATDPMQRVDALQALDSSEQQQLLVEWNGTARDYPREQSIQQLFEEQVRRSPNNIAVIFENQKLSYEELNRWANQFAHYLIKLGIGSEARVGICLERSVEMVVALLGIAKAGAVYVALDANSPSQRLEAMLQESAFRLLVTQSSLRDRLEPVGVPIVCVEEARPAIATENSNNPKMELGGDHLAYVSYTSGSTGKPKGVSVPHRAVVRLVKNNQYARLGSEEVLLQFAPVAFDASTLEMWGSLLNGGRLVVMPPGYNTTAEIGRVLVEYGVTTIWLTAGLFHLMVDEQPEALKHVNQVLAGGDVLSVGHVNRYLNGMNEDAVLINGYGPTENTTFSCCHRMNRGERIEGTVPIGRPIGNTQVYVLNQEMQVVPVGVIGELYLAGEGLARGYENDAALTAEKFLPNPYGAAGTRLYRSGDEVCWRSDGVLEFVGRADRQVKVRGYRVEPSEIEQVLGKCAGVREAVVAVQEKQSGEKVLVAYVVMDGTQGFSIPELQNDLKARLPDYMCPGALVVLDSLPLTRNGKVDYQALPKPDTSATAGTLVAPRTPVEHAVAEIWRQVFAANRLGIDDNFFQLGGHSMLALQIASRVRGTLGVPLPLRSVFEEPTIADQARAIERLLGNGKSAPAEIQSNSRPENVPLSFAQQRLWFLHQLEPTSDFYNVPIALRLRGSLNLGALTDCFTEIVRRHEILRTTFPIRQGIPVQQIHQPAFVALEVTDLRHLPLEQAEINAREFIAREALRPFDLSRGPLLRLFLFCLAKDEQMLLINMHHIIVDGWSLGVLMREMTTLYEAFSAGRSLLLPPLPIQYADYSLWQREWFSGERMESELAYWRQQLSNASPLELPADYPRPKVQTFRGAKKSTLLAPELLESLRGLTYKESSTIFMAALAAFKVLLYRYSNQPEITVGTPVAGRTQSETESLIGFFVNTLVLRTIVAGDPRFTEFLRQVREVSLGAYAHQELPYEKLVEELHPGREQGRSPLFQVMFALEDTVLPQLEFAGLQISPVEIESPTAKFDLLTSIRESSQGLHVSFQYNSDLFEDATIERMMGYFQQLLRGAGAESRQHISAIPILTEGERRQITVEWNQRECSFFGSGTVLELLEAQARTSPEAIAVVFEGKQLSYSDLHEQADYMARFLRNRGVRPEVKVGVCMERSEQMVIALLAIMKAGGVYVPLEPGLPSERLSHMIENAQFHLVLTQEWLKDRLPENAPQVICMDTLREIIARQNHAGLQFPLERENPAYIIYTSGSTGIPKGVVVTHAGLLNHMAWMQHQFPFDQADRILQKTAFSFDASVWEFWAPLMAGAVLVMARPQSQQDPEYLIQCVQDQEITVLQLTPTHLRLLLAQPAIANCGSLKRVYCGGESLVEDLVEKFYRQLSWAKLYNLYGPTEATIDATFNECIPGRASTGAPLGRPIANTQAYVLDHLGELAPVGSPGELYIGGNGVARGYLEQPGLTAQHFLPDPFSGIPGARLYKTGDLVRQRNSGELEFLGRLDHQVKLRGYRIELEEIETALRQHPEVVQAVVVLREDEARDRRLVGYVAASNGAGGLSAHDVRDYVKAKLPEYMVPMIVVVDEIPITANGKIDYNALPPLSSDSSSATRSYVAPRNVIEEQIEKACCDLLGIQRMGVHDNFFDLGGHSLLAMRLMTWLRETFQVETIPLRDFFATPTIAGVATLVVRCEARPGQSEKIAKFLQHLNAMSAEEVLAMRAKHAEQKELHANRSSS